jgi:hypothetical protein
MISGLRLQTAGVKEEGGGDITHLRMTIMCHAAAAARRPHLPVPAGSLTPEVSPLDSCVFMDDGALWVPLRGNQEGELQTVQET